jgi:hypothetical protein
MRNQVIDRRNHERLDSDMNMRETMDEEEYKDRVQ